MIDDAELRLLFQIESEERIASLKEGISQLKEKPDGGTIEAIFRDAHTLKGAARMLMLSTIESNAAALEDILDKLRKGAIELQPNLLGELLDRVVEIENLIVQELTGPQEKELQQPKKQQNPVPINQNLKNKQNTPQILNPTPTSKNKIPEQAASVFLSSQKEVSHLSNFQNTTIRISKKQIFELTKHAADLMVTQNKITTIVDDIQAVLQLIETSLEHLSFDVAKDPMYWEETLRKIEKQLTKLHESSYQDIFKLGDITSVLAAEVRRLGLLPISKLFDLFPSMVAEIASASKKEVIFNIEGSDITVDKKIIEEMKDPIMHILRNSISHGIETPKQRLLLSKPKEGRITLRAQQMSQMVIIEIEDDGQGLNSEKIKQKALNQELFSESALAAMPLSEIYGLIFIPGFSTSDEVSEISGRGIGLDVVKKNVEKLQGTIQVESEPGQGCRFIIELPTTLLTTHVSIVQIYNQIFALPIEVIEAVTLISFGEIFQIHNQDVFLYKSQPVSIHFLAHILNISPPEEQNVSLVNLQGSKIPCIVFNIRGKFLAVIVDAVLDEQQVVLFPFKILLEKIPNIIGATTLKTGQVCLVVDPLQIIKNIKAMRERPGSFLKIREAIKETQMKKKILLIDDSYAIRLYCKKVLEDEGYEVLIAEDGMDGLQKFDEGGLDAIITDIQMPQMDGLTLIKIIRKQRQNFVIPIIIMTTLESEFDRKNGMQAGANAYISKGGFSQKELISTLKHLIA